MTHENDPDLSERLRQLEHLPNSGPGLRELLGHLEELIRTSSINLPRPLADGADYADRLVDTELTPDESRRQRHHVERAIAWLTWHQELPEKAAEIKERAVRIQHARSTWINRANQIGLNFTRLGQFTNLNAKAKAIKRLTRGFRISKDIWLHPELLDEMEAAIKELAAAVRRRERRWAGTPTIPASIQHRSKQPARRRKRPNRHW